MKPVLVRLLALSCLMVAASYVAMLASHVTPGWAPYSLAVGANGVIVTLMAIGAMRRGTLPRSLGWTFVGLFALCAGAFVIALSLPAREGVNGPLLLGLPLRTAIVLYGVGVVPIAILPLAYALTFESSTLDDRDLARVREAFVAMQSRQQDNKHAA